MKFLSRTFRRSSEHDDEILIAAKNLLTALELWLLSERPEVMVRSCAAHLQEAVDRAEGRRP